MHAVWQHPQLAARQRWRSVQTAAGQVAALLPPALPQDVEPRMDPVPALGQHTEHILGSLGFAPAAIARLRAAGVV